MFAFVVPVAKRRHGETAIGRREGYHLPDFQLSVNGMTTVLTEGASSTGCGVAQEQTRYNAVDKAKARCVDAAATILRLLFAAISITAVQCL